MSLRAILIKCRGFGDPHLNRLGVCKDAEDDGERDRRLFPENYRGVPSLGTNAEQRVGTGK